MAGGSAVDGGGPWLESGKNEGLCTMEMVLILTMTRRKLTEACLSVGSLS